MRVRINYSVQGKIRFISHLDIIRAFHRACIRSDIPVSVSQGFSPHLKFSFGHPLSVGVSGSSEYADMYFDENVDLVWLKNALQSGLPEGINIISVFEEDDRSPSLCAFLNKAVYSAEIPAEYATQLKYRLNNFSMDSVKDIRLEKDRIFMYVSVGNKNVRPITVLEKIFPEAGIEQLKLWHVNRERLYNE